MQVWTEAVLSSVCCDTAGENQEEDSEEEDPMDTFYPQALAGFIMVMTEEGDVIYLTENVSKHIGMTQVRQNKKEKWFNILVKSVIFHQISQR